MYSFDISELELQAELNLPRGVHGAEDQAPTRQRRGSSKDRISVAALPIGVLGVHGRPEVGVVGKVEQLGAKLHIYSLADASVFEDRKVEIPEIRTAANVASGVAIETGRHWLEDGRVKPFRRVPEDCALLPRCDVGAVGKENRPVLRAIVSLAYRKGERRVQRQNATDLPTFHQASCQSGQTRAERFVRAKWQFVQGIENKIVARIKGRGTPIILAVIQVLDRAHLRQKVA